MSQNKNNNTIDSISAVYTVDTNQIKKQFNFLIQMISNKKTKIVATLGPACSTREIIKT
jgi:archaellum biogenesis ATPase FlaH